MIGLNLYKVGKERCTSYCTRCTCRTARDAHVALYEMHMSYSASHRRKEYFSKAKAIYLPYIQT